MSPSTLGLILLSVGMSAAAQLLLKMGMSVPAVASAVAERRWQDAVLAISSNLWIASGLGLYLLSMVVWLIVLAKLDVSQAYPFVGLGLVLTMLMGWLWMGETLDAMRVSGTFLIALGVILVAKSA